ncbi:MAG: chemotaxis protein CheX [Pseudomonadota bacterium]
MTTSRLKVEDIKIFSDAAMAFFSQTTGHKAAVRTAYMLGNEETVVWNDFQGRIDLSGHYRGSVTFSAPRGLLTHVLLTMGESSYTDASHRDIVGEITNQMSGYARRHFGESMDISPPRVITQGEGVTPPVFNAAPFVIPMLWDRYEAHLVVRMGKAGGL